MAAVGNRLLGIDAVNTAFEVTFTPDTRRGKKPPVSLADTGAA